MPDSKLPRYMQQEGVSIETLAYLFLIIMTTGGIFLDGTFYPDAQATIPDWVEVFLLGLFFIMVLSINTGLAARGRSNAGVMAIGTKKMPAAKPNPIGLVPRACPVNVGAIQIDPSWPPSRKAAVEDAKRYLTRIQGAGEPVPMDLMWAGGYSYYKGEWTFGNHEAALLDLDSGLVLQEGQNTIVLADVDVLQHDLLDPDTVADITEKTSKAWIRGDTKTFITLGARPKVVEFLKSSHAIRDIIHEADGWPGAARSFLSVLAQRFPSLDGRALDDGQFGRFLAEFKSWAQRNGIDAEPPVSGLTHSQVVRLWLSELGIAEQYKKERDTWRSTAQRYAAIAEGKATRMEKLYGPTGTGGFRDYGRERDAELRGVPGAGRFDEE